MIRCDQLTKVYRRGGTEVRSLDVLDLEVQEGEFVSIRGPSGCGKTTLLLALGGMLHPTSGNVIVAGEDLYRLDAKRRAQVRSETIGFVFQMFHLIPYLNVLENVLLASGTSPADAALKRAKDLLTRFGMGPRLEHTPSELSAGERQRTAIARALLNKPKLVLADEPTGNLDPENTEEVFLRLSEFHKAGGTVIVVSHGSAAEKFSDRVIPMCAGKIVVSS
ncbi:MAG: ABC transporter ATP-binding protein [Verrucomicrobia bacterium]|nr:ABC transporter ATP-binding protein [Verrucomicrobiota bacterium]